VRLLVQVDAACGERVMDAQVRSRVAQSARILPFEIVALVLQAHRFVLVAALQRQFATEEIDLADMSLLDAGIGIVRGCRT
jgi:hypothetical protein